VEAALVLPLVIVLVMGIIDFGFAFGSKTTASGASRSGVRLAAAAYATAGTASTNQKAAVDKIANTVTGALTGLTSATVIGMVVYKLDPTSANGAPLGGFPDDNMSGGCTSECFRYRWDGTKLVYVSGAWPDPDACGLTLDDIGVMVQVNHHYITGFVGSHVYLDGHTVMRLEPLPSDQCSSSNSG